MMQTLPKAGMLAVAIGLMGAPLAHAGQAATGAMKTDQAYAGRCQSITSASFMRDLAAHAGQPSELIRIWNKIMGPGSSTKEVRQLRFGRIEAGRVTGPEQAVFVSDRPLDVDSMRLKITKTGGEATTPVIVCITDQNGQESILEEATVPAKTGKEAQEFDLTGLKGKFVSLRLAPEGDKTFDYQVSAKSMKG
jgi:hypothetical protein